MIEAKGLTKRFGRSFAVDELSFTVQPGRVTGFLGPNGAGKSTTMRLVLGLDVPSSGSVTVNGRRYADIDRPLFEVGALLDAGAVHPGRRARDQLTCLAASNGIGPRRVDQVLALVGLDEVAGRRCGALSLGMRQRLGIAGALLGDPSVLLFDVPVNGLDPEGIHWVRGLLRSLAAEGRTIFVSSHLMSEMALTADHLLVIGRGRLLADASVEDFVAAATPASVVVGSPAAGRLAAALVSAGASVESIAPDRLVVGGMGAGAVGEMALRHSVALNELVTSRPSLEEAYLALTGESVEFRSSAGRPPAIAVPAPPAAALAAPTADAPAKPGRVAPTEGGAAAPGP